MKNDLPLKLKAGETRDHAYNRNGWLWLVHSTTQDQVTSADSRRQINK